MRIMLDTNVVVSALISPSGSVASLLERLAETHETCLASISVLEAETVFRQKFPDRLHVLDKFISSQCRDIMPTPDVLSGFPALRNKADRRVLASAIQSGADVLLTGDRDFAGLGLERPKILSPAEFRAAGF